MRNSRLALAFNGVIMVLLGIVFWFFPELFTVAMFPSISENEQAINVGIALRKNMGVGCIFIGMLLFWCQTSSKTTAQRLLFCSSFGFGLMVAGLLEVRLTGQANVPLPIILLFACMSIYSLFVATRRYQE
ncbi:MAG: hypothetical protein CMM80_05585 [Rhodospirillaceae bacterium]|nr:hypothetical protein [Rhodospirillaceae bacterium]|tara:strand:- start:72 stop:464 length:393 start_codon:yes stop_codon:yes gene_type:complete